MKKYLIVATQVPVMLAIANLFIFRATGSNGALDIESQSIGFFFLGIWLTGVAVFFWKAKLPYFASLCFQYITLIFSATGILALQGLLSKLIAACLFLLISYTIAILNSEAYRSEFNIQKPSFWGNFLAAVFAFITISLTFIWYHHT